MSNNINELQHHGILGQKWGIRRYQNKDGTLTAAGKRREARLDKQMAKQARKYNELKSKKLTGNGKKENAPKTIKDMSIEELQSKTRRLNAEKDYIEAVKNRTNAEPEQIKKGEKFAKTMWEDVIAPAATDTAKQVAKSYMVKYTNEFLGFDDDLKVHTNNKKK